MELASAPVGRRRPAGPRVPGFHPVAGPGRRRAKAVLAAGPSAIRAARGAPLVEGRLNHPRGGPHPPDGRGTCGMQPSWTKLTKPAAAGGDLAHQGGRELGDLSENADYDAPRKEQSFLEGRVQAA